MSISVGGLGFALCMSVIHVSTSAQELCNRLDAFEHARFPADRDAPRRHWVEMHWLGTWLDFSNPRSVECRHSADEASSTLCAWLAHHTSLELPDRMPRAILICHGYRFPDLTYWDGWKASVSLPNRAGENVLLQIDQAEHRTQDAAMRLSVFPEGEDEATQPLAPMFKNSDVPPDKPGDSD